MAKIRLLSNGQVTAEIRLSTNELIDFCRESTGGKKTEIEIKSMLAEGAVANMIGHNQFMVYFSKRFHELFGQEVTELMKQAVEEVMEISKTTGQSIFDGEKVHLSDKSRQAILRAFQSQGAQVVEQAVNKLVGELNEKGAMYERVSAIFEKQMEERAGATARSLLRTYLANVEVQEEVGNLATENLPKAESVKTAPDYVQDDFLHVHRSMLEVRSSVFFGEMSRYESTPVHVYALGTGRFLFTEQPLPPNRQEFVSGTIIGAMNQQTNNEGVVLTTTYYLTKH